MARDSETHTGKRVKRERGTGNGSGNPDASSDSLAGGAESISWASSGTRAAEALGWLLTRDDGWLRIVPQDHGKCVYFKWKFTRGDYAGSYVMYVVTDQFYDAAFLGLWTKIERCYTKEHTPTPDTPYG